MPTKGFSGFFFILIRFRVINKNVKKNKYLETRSFLIFENNLIFKQNKKKSRTPFEDIAK